MWDLLRASLVTVCFIALLEGGLQATGTWFTGSFYTQDSVMGFVLRPGASGWYTTESDNFLQINRDGFNDIERSVEKPPDTFRIAVLGASEVENVSLPLDQSLTHYIEMQLSRCGALPRRRVEVLNFGIASYTMAQEYLLLQNRVWKYRPDLVILGFTVESSVLNNVRKTSVVGTRTPYYVYQDGKLVQDEYSYLATSFDVKAVARHNRLGDWGNRFQLLSLANWAQINLNTSLQKLRPQPADPNAMPPGSARIWCFLPPRIPEVEEAWHITEGIFDMMNSAAQEHGAEFWIATLDAPAQDTPDLAERAALRREIGVADLYYTERRVAAIAAKLGIREMELAPRLADYTAAHQVSIHGFFRTQPNEGHWNAMGNQLAGKLIAEDLCRSWTSRSAH